MKKLMSKLMLLVDREKRPQLLGIFLMMVVGAFLEVIGVSLMVPLITAVMNPDIIMTNSVVRWCCELLDLHSYRTFVIVCIIVMIAVFIVKDVFLILQYYVSARFTYSNRFAMQKKLLHTYLYRPYEYYLNAQSGEVIRVIQTDVTNAFSLLESLLFFASEAVVSVALLITVFIVDPQMTLFIAASLGITLIVIQRIVKPILRKAGLDYQKSNALTNKWLIQAINGIKEVKVIQKEAFFENCYNESGERVIRAENKNRVANNIPRLLIEMVCVCSVLIIIAVMIFFGRDINTLMPALAAFAMAAVKLMPSANRIVSALNAISYYGPSVDKLEENLNALKENPDAYSHREVKPPMEFNKEIVIDKLSYTYPGGASPVLSEADMTIPVGRSVGIVGTSGAGKTTAVDIMLGLLTPDSGHVYADGKDVFSDYSAWLSAIGYIPQTIFMLDDTIRANVAFGEKEADDEKVWHALKEAQLDDFIRSLPKGLDTSIGERGIRLSGGQRQRIGIARVLYSDPKLLIFDEATSALDNETEAAIMESINHLHGKKTMIIIAHRLQTIEGCDMVYRVKDGKIIRER